VTGRTRVVLWIVFLAACAAVASQAHFTTDLSAFLPRSPTPSQRILVDQLRAGVVSQVILIGVQGAPQDKLAQVSNALVERLAQAPEFAYASNGAQERMEADGNVLAVVARTAVNQDGRTTALTAPSGRAQAAVIR